MAKKEKKKREKVVWVDDGRTIADMSILPSRGLGKSLSDGLGSLIGEPQPFLHLRALQRVLDAKPYYDLSLAVGVSCVYYRVDLGEVTQILKG